MNAVIDTEATPQLRVAPHPTHKLKLLLRREFWEHKGGFFWAPLVASGIALVFVILGAIGGSIFKAKHGNDIHIDGANAAEISKALGGAGDIALIVGIAISLIVLGFVVFFYCLGSLYDERKDRSVLFWKSLPVSDTDTVAAKVIWAIGLAPILSVAIGIVTGLALWVIAALTTTINGLPGATGVFIDSHPIRIIANVIALVPLYALWALPAVGWLMLCSAWARSKPFMWAVMIPVLGCALISFANVVLGMDYDVGPLWYTAAYRGLLSVFPTTWLPVVDSVASHQIHGPEDVSLLVNASEGWALARTGDLWIGALAGAAMIYAAIRLRRWRDDN